MQEFSDDKGSPESLQLLVWLSELLNQSRCTAPTVVEQRKKLSKPLSLGRFRLHELLGTGSYGVVFRADDHKLGHPVALKIAWPSVMIDAEASQRFMEEPKTVAKLSHPGIVRVYDSGNVDLAYYIAFELIEGQTLGNWIAKRDNVRPNQAARIVQLIAEALQFAHERGVIHRDLKPSNVLMRASIDQTDSSQFQPIITDFGLARRDYRVDGADATATTAFLGTDRYMSPEQAIGQSREVGPTSDVFSLGVILYELVTGILPFEGDSSEQIRDQICRHDPPAMQFVRRGIPRDIGTVVMKCLEKQPSHRYASAGELAEDLRRCLTGQPILARSTPPWRRAWKLARRRSQPIAFVSLFVAVGLVASGFVGAFVVERRAAGERLVVANHTAAMAEDQERQHQYAKRIRYASRSLTNADRREISHHLEAARKLAHGNVYRGLEWRLLSAMASEIHMELPPALGAVRTVRFSPNQNHLICGGADRQLTVWDTDTWQPLQTIKNLGGTVENAEYSPSGRLLAIGTEDGHVVILRTSDFSTVFDEKLFEQEAFNICWIEGEHSVAAGGRDAILAIIDTRSGEVRKTEVISASATAIEATPERPNEISAIAFLASRRLIAVLKAPTEIVLIDPGTLHEIERWNNVGFFGSFTTIPGSPELLAAAGSDKLALLSTIDGSTVTSGAVGHLFRNIRYSAANKQLFGCFRDGSVHGWRVDDLLHNKFESSTRVAAHRGDALTCDQSSDGKWIASGGKDRAVRVWSQLSENSGSQFTMTNYPASAQFSPCGRWLIIGERRPNNTNFLSLYEVSNGRRCWRLEQPIVPVYADNRRGPYRKVDFDGSGETFVIRELDGGIGVRKSETGELLRRLDVPELDRNLIVYSPNHKELIIQGNASTRIIDVVSGNVIERLPATRNIVGCFSTPAGELWLETDVQRNCSFRSRRDGRVFRTVPNRDRHEILNTALSTDGRKLALSWEGATINLLDMADAAVSDRLIAEDHVMQLLFSRDGRTLVSRQRNGTVTFWHAPTASELLSIGSMDEKILCCALSPTDDMLVFGIQHNDKNCSLRMYRFDDRGRTLPVHFNIDSPSNADDERDR